ncbi:MAG: ATP-binding protein [Candidatus Acidiferrales bacterium]
MVTDFSLTVAAVWSSLRSGKQGGPHRLLGRRLSAVIHPRLLKQIKALASQTAGLDRREELHVQLKDLGESRWFSICVMPLKRLGEEGFAACLMARDFTQRIEAQDALTKREALLARAEQVAHFGSWEMDLKTKEVKLSPQLMKMYEIAPDQEWSEDTYWNRMHPGDRARVHMLAEKSMAAGKPYDFVARYCAPDGRVRVHLAHTVPLVDARGKVAKAMGVIQDVTEHAVSHRELRRLSQQLMCEQDNQRRHLARELHESAGQSLAALKMTLGRVREALPERAELAASLLESAALLADGAVREVRTVSYLLHPPMLDDAGLGPALHWYATGFTERSGIRATLEIQEPFPRYTQEIETTVFRVVQEALTNVHRYSGSATAEIRVLQENSHLRVEIRDRGCGIPPSADPLHRRTELGVGISGMRERVEQLDGIFEFDSAPGDGSTVRVLLPVLPSKPARPKFTPPGSHEGVPIRRNYASQTRSRR